MPFRHFFGPRPACGRYQVEWFLGNLRSPDLGFSHFYGVGWNRCSDLVDSRCLAKSEISGISGKKVIFGLGLRLFREVCQVEDLAKSSRQSGVNGVFGQNSRNRPFWSKWTILDHSWPILGSGWGQKLHVMGSLAGEGDRLWPAQNRLRWFCDPLRTPNGALEDGQSRDYV